MGLVPNVFISYAYRAPADAYVIQLPSHADQETYPSILLLQILTVGIRIRIYRIGLQTVTNTMPSDEVNPSYVHWPPTPASNACKCPSAPMQHSNTVHTIFTPFTPAQLTPSSRLAAHDPAYPMLSLSSSTSRPYLQRRQQPTQIPSPSKINTHSSSSLKNHTSKSSFLNNKFDQLRPCSAILTALLFPSASVEKYLTLSSTSSPLSDTGT